MVEFLKWVLSDFWRFLMLAILLYLATQWTPIYIERNRFIVPKDAIKTEEENE